MPGRFRFGADAMRILLIDTDKHTAETVRRLFDGSGDSLDVTPRGEEGIRLGRSVQYDAILLDLRLDDMTGYNVLKQLRAVGIQTPVIILSAETEMNARVRVLSDGADDYVVKPFHAEELKARIRAVIRRTDGSCHSLARVGRLSVNLDHRTAFVEGKRISLTGREYEILEFMIRRQGTTLRKEAFLEYIYGGRDEPSVKIVDIYIHKLRKKLVSACGGENYIHTVWGEGYVLRANNVHQDRIDA